MNIDNATILWNRSVAPSCYRIGLTTSAYYAFANPGQFVMLRLPDRSEPLLRRPFSIHRIIDAGTGVQGIEILYKVVGRFTRKLSFCQPGDIVDVLGPLGHGFSVSDTCTRIYMAAGGVGVAPLYFLAASLDKRRFDLSQCHIFLGGRSKSDILCEAEFAALNLPVHVSTDDGSYGDACLLTHPLEALVKEQPPDIILACGPTGMLACVAGIAETFHVPCQVSIETIMACGMGACLGCAVQGKDTGPKRLHACLDGPVIDSRLLDFGEHMD